jgi:sugar/nucleoside kinase (ribokinase family)
MPHRSAGTQRAFDIAVVSGVGIDTNVYLQRRDIDFAVEANFTENVDYVGQAGGYTARGFARLGKRTALIDTVGDDYQGRFIREELQRDGINVDALFTDAQGTRRSVNFMYIDGRRKNFYDGKGAMSYLPDSATCRSVLQQTRLAHFNIINWSRHLLPVARELGLTISCDLQDVVTAEDSYRQDYVKHADILFFSATNFDDPSPLIRSYLQAKQERIVLVGLGDRGCALGTGEEIRYWPAVNLREPIVDTNGAGDALVVGFLSSYCMDGFSLEDSVLRAQIAARYTCSVRANSSHLITRQRLDQYFEALKGETGKAKSS